MPILVLVIYAALFAYEFIPMYKQKLWREMWVNGALGLLSLTTALLLSFGVKIPSPEGPIRIVITSLFGK